MNPFRLVTPTTVQEAVQAFARHQQVDAGLSPSPQPAVAYLAGGTTVVDLLKLGVLTPRVLVDLTALSDSLAEISVDADGLSVGALATMAEVAAHPDVARAHPAVVQAIGSAASAQLRNVATIGGNLLQRTRCPYFRDGVSACNKRAPGSGCTAVGGDTRGLAVLGTSDACLANYPGDLAVALTALDASVSVATADGGAYELPVADLYRLPGDRPDLETVLAPGDLVTAVRVPDGGWQASVYVKVRDRASYAFALTSAAVALRSQPDGRIADVRVVLGGLAARPWRCREAEELLRGGPLTPETAAAAAATCLVDARVDQARAFAVELGRRTVVRALLDAHARVPAGA